MESKRKKQLWIIGGIIGFILIIILINSNKISNIKKEKDSEIATLQKEISTNEGLLAEKDTEITQLTEKVESAKPWFELSEKEQERKVEEEKKETERIAAEKKAKEKKEKLAAEKKAKEKADKKAEEVAEAKKKEKAEEKKGYDTGITYDQLARNPDDYEGDKIKFRGKVIQVMEGDGETQIRIAVNSNIDTILYGAFDASLVESRILEDDIVTLMGISAGLLSYESTMGGNITIPSMLIFDIDQ